MAESKKKNYLVKPEYIKKKVFILIFFLNQEM